MRVISTGKATGRKKLSSLACCLPCTALLNVSKTTLSSSEGNNRELHRCNMGLIEPVWHALENKNVKSNQIGYPTRL